MVLPYIITTDLNTSTASDAFGSVSTSFSEIIISPKTRLLFKNRFHGLVINSMLPVTIDYSDDLFIVCDEVFGVYGDGDSEAEALEDYLLSLSDYYQLVKNSASRRKEDEKELKRLHDYITIA